MSLSSTTGISTAAVTPAGSIRGDPDNTTSPPWNSNRPRDGGASAVTARSAIIPEGKVVVWDVTMQQLVVKNKGDVKLKTWKTRLRDAAWRFWAGGPLSCNFYV